jgi:RNA polymerase sigma factor (sigma-70 family)
LFEFPFGNLLLDSIDEDIVLTSRADGSLPAIYKLNCRNGLHYYEDGNVVKIGDYISVDSAYFATVIHIDLDNIFIVNKGLQSLNTEVSANSKSEGFTLEDLVADYASKKTDEYLEDEDLKEIVRKILNKMPEKHRIVIELYYGLKGEEPKTLDEIGDYLGLTRERIRQVKKDAIRYLGSKKNYKIVQPYMK